MPKLGEYSWLPETVCFLYRSAEDARAGVGAGATAFFAGLPSDRWPETHHHIYAITNWHVACRGGSSVIRVNGQGRSPTILETDPSEWHFLPGPQGYDIAVYPLGDRLTPDHHKISVLNLPSFFLTDDEIMKKEIGVAEDVFMIGRFIDYDGHEVNEPALRFGNISIMRAPIEQPNGCKRPSYVLDMHSRTGYSGSPVFIYRTTGSGFAKPKGFFTGHMLKLLGIHWGQFPELWEIEGGPTIRTEAESLIVEGSYVKGLSGMTCVCPSSAIMETLKMPSLKKMREEQEAEWARQMGRSRPPNAELAETSGGASSDPQHRERFKALLGAAVKLPKSSD